ncbi:MAG: hypothetical protein PVF83_06685 [Anaerolineales bacterium]|jgi:hypothetical protein
MEWIQDCWWLACDEETVGYYSVIDSLSAGDGSIPHTPLPEEEPSPDPCDQRHTGII